MSNVTFARDLEKQFARIAYQIGHDEFGLKDDEFVIRLWSAKQGRGWNVQRGKSIIRIYFSISPMDDDAPEALRRALAQAREIKKSKRTDVCIFEGLKVPPKGVPSAYREMYGLPPLLDRSELEETIEYKVTLKHRLTGVVVVKSGEIKPMAIHNLIEAGREEITEKVIEIVRKLTQKQEQSSGGDQTT